MSNKTQLQTNNTALDGYIARINAAKEVAAGLPEAGGGGSESVETCSLIITDPGMKIATFCYQPAFGEWVEIVADPITPASGTYEVVRGSMFFLDFARSAWTVAEGCEAAYNNGYQAIYVITAGAGESATVDVG
jgi:hypothetical protein